MRLILFVILLFPAAAPPPALALDWVIHLLTWGEEGTDLNQFSLPSKVAVDAAGNVYVADRGNSRIQKFDSEGTLLDHWGGVGTDNGQFNKPLAITVGPSGNIYVTDYLNHRIQKFTPGGSFITKWGSPCLLKNGCVDPDLGGPLEPGDGQFQFPIGIAVDAGENVYVVDRDNNRVQKFTGDGTFLTKWGSSGSGNGQFFIPLAVVLDGAGNVYVSDSNNRIQKFTGEGVFLDSWGSDLNTPAGLAMDVDGKIYVSDTNNHLVKIFFPDGTPFFEWGGLGTEDAWFDSPVGIAVDPGLNIYVVDSRNHRIQKFVYSTPVLPVTWGTLKDRYRPPLSSGNKGG